MSNLPFDPVNPSSDDETNSYLLPKNNAPVHPGSEKAEREAATEFIRKKLDRLYSEEPDAEEEIEEMEVIKPHSKHQEFMQELVNSGKSLAEIQTEWHHYYVTLPDNEKHEVWQEFYESNKALSKYHKKKPAKQHVPEASKQVGASNGVVVSEEPQTKVLAVHPAPTRKAPKLKDARSSKEVKDALLNHVSAGGKLKAKHHLQSLAFGLSMGFIVIFIFLFTFFNEVIITPFIQPNSRANATPLILSTDGVAPTANPEVIIPKINVEIPVDFSQNSTNEADIENALESGVVHYPTTVMPGQKGNTAYFGHSSNNIFNKGKYKFAFVLLHTLENGDTFYLTNNGKVYVYKVISKTVVEPNEVGVLGPVAGQTATATLITCDPPGTSLHRLVVVGQQISPDPAGNTDATGTASTSQPTRLPDNGPTLWSRMWHSIF